MTEEEKIALKIAERVLSHQVDNYLKRGISNTGRTAKSWRVELGKSAGSGATAYVKALQHVIFLDRGVKAENVPYGGAPTGKKSSKYIEGLISYFRSKGLSLEDAKGAAFGTAKLAAGKNKDGRGHPKDKNKLGFLQLTAAQEKDVKEYTEKLTKELIQKIRKQVINI